MSKELDTAVSSVMNRIGEWTDDRLANFIAQIIKSGDVFLIHGPTKFITEENIDKTRLINFSACNLSAYEPFHLRESLERQLKAERERSRKLVEALEMAIGSFEAEIRSAANSAIEEYEKGRGV